MMFLSHCFLFHEFKVYCDMNNGGWTLISRFSNVDSKHWMQYNGSWWYDRTTAYGSIASTSDKYDMISPAFWLVGGNYIKMSRSDYRSHGYLLYTSSCLGGGTFRNLITGHGNFRNGRVWNSNGCHGRCYIPSGAHGSGDSSTPGFTYIDCGSNLQNDHYVSFWCDWRAGDGAVIMVGGGGDSCSRADHGIGVTEAGSAQFGNTGQCYNDFGDNCNFPTSYSINLWIK